MIKKMVLAAGAGVCLVGATRVVLLFEGCGSANAAIARSTARVVARG